jgi:hypothetical protein
MSSKDFDSTECGYVVELLIDDDELEAALEQELLELSSSCQPLGPKVAKCAKGGFSVGDQSERAERFTLSGRPNRLSNQLA